MAVKQATRAGTISPELVRAVAAHSNSKTNARKKRSKEETALLKKLQRPLTKRLMLQDEVDKKHSRRLKLMEIARKLTNVVVFRFLEVGFHMLVSKQTKERERETLRQMFISAGKDPKLANKVCGARLAHNALLKHIDAAFLRAHKLSTEAHIRNTHDISIRLPRGMKTIKEADVRLMHQDLLVFNNGSILISNNDPIVDEFRLRAQIWAGYVLGRPFRDDVEKAIYYNQYVKDNIRYGNSWYSRNQRGIANVSSIIMNREEVCKGQSAVLNAMLTADGIDSRYCVGIVSWDPQNHGRHAWCTIHFEDQDYLLDPTAGSYYKTEEAYGSGKYMPEKVELFRSIRH